MRPEPVAAMSIKKRIWIFQLVVILAVITVAAAALFGVRATDNHLSRIQLSRQNLEAAMRLAVDANRFSEQIAELLLIGEPERPDFESARSETSAAISALRTIARDEIDFVRDPAQAQQEQRQFERLDEILRLFREIDRAVERVLLLDQLGRKAEAISLFRSEIENRLDAEFQNLITTAVADERDEVAAADAEARRISGLLVAGSLALLGMLVAVSVGSGYLLTRSLSEPLEALADGALAVERGDLDHRITYLKVDELGLVAARFNAMVEELQRQRQALNDARTHLESQVAARTRELGEANRQLTELDQQRVRFLADVSHELRTPLTVLRGEAEVTLRGTSRPEASYRAALANIVAQAIDMGRLVDDLLFLARSEAEDLRFDFHAVPLSKLVSEAVREASVLARDRRMEVSVDGADRQPMIRADPRRLKQAILIVLDNALKYAGSQAHIEVGVCAVNGHAEITVQNDGAVIPPEEVPHVFERFYRGANASQTGGGGSGLGLAIARWIIEKHDGTIDLSSSPGQGTEVRIQLPSASLA
jgi:signal transduction histidine kinase